MVKPLVSWGTDSLRRWRTTLVPWLHRPRRPRDPRYPAIGRLHEGPDQPLFEGELLARPQRGHRAAQHQRSRRDLALALQGLAPHRDDVRVGRPRLVQAVGGGSRVVEPALRQRGPGPSRPSRRVRDRRTRPRVNGIAAPRRRLDNAGPAARSAVSRAPAQDALHRRPRRAPAHACRWAGVGHIGELTAATVARAVARPDEHRYRASSGSRRGGRPDSCTHRTGSGPGSPS